MGGERDVKQSEPGLEKTGKREARNNAKEKYKGKENGSKTTFLQKVSKLNLYQFYSAMASHFSEASKLA